MAMVFKWSSTAIGFRSLDPQVVGERLDRIREANGGELYAAAVVEDARSKRSPLHAAFNWNDQSAAEEYRIIQARHLIRSVSVVIDADPEREREARAFVIVKRPDRARHYENMVRVLSDEELREQILGRAYDELQNWRARYQELAELVAVFEAIDRLPPPIAEEEKPVRVQRKRRATKVYKPAMQRVAVAR